MFSALDAILHYISRATHRYRKAQNYLSVTDFQGCVEKFPWAYSLWRFFCGVVLNCFLDILFKGV